MRVLVTGAAGFVGRSLCAQLSSRKHTVTAAVRGASGGLVGCHVLHIGTMDAGTDWTSALTGVDAVIHLAARVHVMHDPSPDPLADFRKINVDATLNLARQAAAAGVKRFVFLSSIKVNGEATSTAHAFTELDVPQPLDAYGLSKWEAETGLLQIAIDTGMDVVNVRSPLVYGPGVKANFALLMRAVQHGWPLPLGAVNNRRSLVGLDNLTDFLITCAVHPNAANQTFLISDGDDLSTRGLVQQLARAAGRPCRLWPIPVWVLRLGARLLGKADVVERLCGNLQVDISKARTVLAWVAPLSVSQGLSLAILTTNNS